MGMIGFRVFFRCPGALRRSRGKLCTIWVFSRSGRFSFSYKMDRYKKHGVALVRTQAGVCIGWLGALEGDRLESLAEG
jgi:hypothetical protein